MRIKQIYIILFLGIVSGFTACKSNAGNTLARKWKPIDAAGLSVTPEVKKQITDGSKVIEFTKDGRYITYNNGQKFDRGTYILSGDAKTIRVSSGTGPIQNMTVLALNDDQLVSEMHGITITFKPSKYTTP